MRRIYFVFALAILFTGCKSLKNTMNENPDLDLLVSYMEGSFSSEEQAEKDTTYLHITLDMKQIWKDRKDGAWLYVEQTAAWTPGKPYRQRIYHLEQISATEFSSTICSFEEPKEYIGGHKNPEIFDKISPENIEVLQGCTLYLTYKDGAFSGETKEGECTNAWGEATYATSEVVATKDLMISWDRGWNDNKEQVWGAEKGGYHFKKIGKL